jgi:hypothetical protein
MKAMGTALSALGQAALRLLQQGGSVFPVKADKKPLVEWKPYQTRRPRKEQLCN